ncbi:hypothetical protein ACLOJK_039273 [Asimina triloba]
MVRGTFPSNQCNVYALVGILGDLSRGPREIGRWVTGLAGATGKMIWCVLTITPSMEKKDMQLPVNPKSLISEGVEKCKTDCLDDCFCTAYSYNDSGCFVWYGDLLNLQQPAGENVGGNLCLRLSAPTSKARKAAARSVVIALLGHRLGVGLVETPKETAGDSSIIAVKKLEGLRQGEKQFRSEVSIIGKIQHVNLVALKALKGDRSTPTTTDVGAASCHPPKSILPAPPPWSIFPAG